MKKKFSPEDLTLLRLVSDPKLDPTEKLTLFTVTHPSVKEDKYLSSIWLLDNETRDVTQIISEGNPKTPEWMHDGKSFVYVSTIEKDNEKINELRIFNLSRESSHTIYQSKNPFFNIRVAPNNKHILIVEQVTNKDEDVMVIETIPIWFNGKGYTYKTKNVIKLIDRYSNNFLDVDLGKIDVSYAEFSPDSKKIYYVGVPDREKPYISHLYIYDLEKQENTQLTDENIRVLDFVLREDGNRVFFRGQDYSHGLSTHRKIYKLDVDSKKYSLLTDIDLDAINAINCDVRGPSSSRPLQYLDGYVYFPLSIGGRVALYRVDESGNIESMIEGDFTVENYSIGNKLIAFTRHDPVNPPELYLYDGTEMSKITEFNSFIIETRKMVYPESFRFRASDGEYIDGWIMHPPDFKPDRKYPAILYIHGGPATTFGYSFIFEFQVLASQGFVLVYTNPRGSTGYSQEFKDIRGKYGERDYMDLMEAVDYVIENYPYIDAERFGVTGGSYGGFMTNWIVGHTNRFKAAVTQRSICNWISKFGTTDIGFYFNSDQIAGGFGRPFWEEKWFDIYWDKSPLKYVANVETPTLIIHSIEDYRCWVDQAIQFFTALRYRGVDTRLVLFPKENHDLSRTGKPKHRVERIKHIIAWFKKYLMDSNNS